MGLSEYCNFRANFEWLDFGSYANEHGGFGMGRRGTTHSARIVVTL